MPTIFRAVSGREMAIIIKQHADMMLRSQKIQCQPRAYASAPPSMGPMLGAVVMLFGVRDETGYLRVIAYPTDKALTYEPLSAGVLISAMTP